MTDKKPIDSTDGSTMSRKGSTISLPGVGKVVSLPDGGYMAEGPSGERYEISGDGAISAELPEIRRVQIEDISLIENHVIFRVHETVSHTLHFSGGGVFSYLHHLNGCGMTIEGNNIIFATRPGGVIVVFGTTP